MTDDPFLIAWLGQAATKGDEMAAHHQKTLCGALDTVESTERAVARLGEDLSEARAAWSKAHDNALAWVAGHLLAKGRRMAEMSAGIDVVEFKPDGRISVWSRHVWDASLAGTPEGTARVYYDQKLDVILVARGANVSWAIPLEATAEAGEPKADLDAAFEGVAWRPTREAFDRLKDSLSGESEGDDD